MAILLNMKDRTRSEYGSRLVAARKHADLTQIELSKKLKISQSTLAEAETTGQGSTYTPQFAEACGVSAAWLATGEGEMVVTARWPGEVFTLAQIQQWPKELVQKIEAFAMGYLAALENPLCTVRNNSNNKFVVDEDMNLTVELPLTSKQGKSDGSRNSVSTSEHAKG